METSQILLNHIEVELKNLQKTFEAMGTTVKLDGLLRQLKAMDHEIQGLKENKGITRIDVTPMDLSEEFLEQCAEEGGFNTVGAFLKHLGGMSSVIGHVSWD